MILPNISLKAMQLTLMGQVVAPLLDTLASEAPNAEVRFFKVRHTPCLP
jgi:hypothetical protein